MALPAPQPKMDIPAHYQHLLTTDQIIDTRGHLPLFHSLPGDILEIGCDCGNSTTAFLVGAATSVTSIDTNPYYAFNFPDNSKWRFVLGDSQKRETYDKVCNQRFDVLYVDGSRTYEACLSDLRAYSELVRTGGTILVHDVLAMDNFPGVWRAFSEFRWYTTGGRVSCKYILPGSFGLGVIEL